MRTNRLSFHFLAIPVMLFALAGTAWSTPIWAIGLHEAKAQGLVGEQPNGYLGLVKSGAGADVHAMMNDINARRRQEYQAIARRNKTELKVVEALAGKKAIEQTPPGQWVRLPSGKWVKK